jgi:hypothetical protein
MYFYQDQEAPNDFGWKHGNVYIKSCWKTIKLRKR